MPGIWKHKRLLDNKLQGFLYSQSNLSSSSMKFCVLNLDTMKEKEINVPVVLDRESLNISLVIKNL